MVQYKITQFCVNQNRQPHVLIMVASWPSQHDISTYFPSSQIYSQKHGTSLALLFLHVTKERAKNLIIILIVPTLTSRNKWIQVEMRFCSLMQEGHTHCLDSCTCTPTDTETPLNELPWTHSNSHFMEQYNDPKTYSHSYVTPSIQAHRYAFCHNAVWSTWCYWWCIKHPLPPGCEWWRDHKNLETLDLKTLNPTMANSLSDVVSLAGQGSQKC